MLFRLREAGRASSSWPRALRALLAPSVFGRPALLPDIRRDDRIGGRTWTLRDYFAQGQIAEHGGEFISLDQHGVRQLASELGLRLINVNRHEKGRTTYFFDGERYTVEEARHDYFGTVRERLREDVKAAGYPTTYDQSTPAGRALDRTTVAEWIEQRVPGGMGSKLGALLANSSVGEFGADPGGQSALNFSTFSAWKSIAASILTAPTKRSTWTAAWTKSRRV